MTTKEYKKIYKIVQNRQNFSFQNKKELSDHIIKKIEDIKNYISFNMPNQEMFDRALHLNNSVYKQYIRQSKRFLIFARALDLH